MSTDRKNDPLNVPDFDSNPVRRCPGPSGCEGCDACTQAPISVSELAALRAERDELRDHVASAKNNERVWYRQVERMRPVVEAARAYRETEDDQGRFDDAGVLEHLVTMVDAHAYRAASSEQETSDHA